MYVKAWSHGRARQGEQPPCLWLDPQVRRRLSELGWTGSPATVAHGGTTSGGVSSGTCARLSHETGLWKVGWEV